MQNSNPRTVEGKPIEEVLPAAINATATSEQRASRTGGELARRQAAEETRMAVMRAGSPAAKLTELPAPLLIAAAVLAVVLVVLGAIVLI